MTARSIASATISFGLVSIPVKLFTANESAEDISFNLLHDVDHARLTQQYVCTACKEVVDREHIVKGYEHAKGQYVTFAAAELEALELITNDAITIEKFVPPGEMDPIFCDDANYLVPDKGSERSYALLVQALVDTIRVAVGKYSARGRERLVVIAVRGGFRLGMYKLRYAHEVRDPVELPEFEVPRVKPGERELARRVVASMAAPTFDPSDYKDEVLARRRALIDTKVATGELVAAPAPATGATNPVDLMEALKASLDVAPERSTKTIRQQPKVRTVATKKPRSVRKSKTKGGAMAARP